MPGPISDSYKGPIDKRKLQVTTCVWCGHAFPPGTLAWGQKVLYDHAQVCEKHPCYPIAKERDQALATIAKLEAKLVDMTAKAHQWCGEFQKAHAINGGKQAAIERLERLRSVWKEETDRLNQELADGVKVVSAFLRSYGGDSCHMDMERWVVANSKAHGSQ